MRFGRWLLALGLLLVVGGAWAFDVGQHLELEALSRNRAAWQAHYAAHPLQSVLLYGLTYAALTGASFPGASLITLAGGAVFGLTVGVLATSIASTLGATLAFLTSRHWLRDVLRSRFDKAFSTIDAGMQRQGAYYLFALRMAPIFPFFVVNSLSGLTRISLRTYAWVSWLGMLPGTLVYVNAGTRLGQLQQTSDLASPGVLVSFTLLAILPLMSRKVLSMLARGRARRSAASVEPDRPSEEPTDRDEAAAKTPP